MILLPGWHDITTLVTTRRKTCCSLNRRRLDLLIAKPEAIMENSRRIYLIELNDFILRPCPYMVGIREAWYINQIVLVSPALFQLLRDEKDRETISIVIQQVQLKVVSLEKLKRLVLKKWHSIPLVSYKTITAHVRINFTESDRIGTPGITSSRLN